MTGQGTARAADGTEIAYSVSGQGPWLVLSNSLATDRRMWAPQMEALERAFTVVTFDTRGHGASGVAKTPFTFSTLAADVIALMDVIGIDKARFMGLSLGGMTGLALALERPERVDRVICCDARADAPDAYKAMWDANIELSEKGGMPAIANATLPRWFSESFRANAANAPTLEMVRDMILATPVEGYKMAARCLQTLDLLESLEHISVPVHFVAGSQDPAAPVSVMRDMADRVAGATLDIVEGAAHLSNMEDPDGFLKAAQPHLR
ncbi:MAG: alpha/beta fold hydrolase [Paracoccaceae bacterium]|nr:alpha/beta fold hydrolase [Paracoccaceae bacterium]